VEAFDSFEVERVARFTSRRLESLLRNKGIVRNRAKLGSAINNARAFLRVQHEFGSFAAYQWRFVAGKPLQNTWTSIKNIPSRTPQSDTFSADLKARGFSFCGSTIMYAHMQAVGMVNDHVVGCFRYAQVKRLRAGIKA
jgi:DNA-3-methyladenine glycosylase I